MRHLEPDDIGSELGWYLGQVYEAMNIGSYMERIFIERYDVDLQKQKDSGSSFLDILKTIGLDNIHGEFIPIGVKGDKIAPSLIREMILCICYGVFEHYSLKTYIYAISIVEDDYNSYKEFIKIINRMKRSDIKIDLKNIPLYEETQMIRRLRNIIMHNYSIVPQNPSEARMSQDEYDRFLNYLKDHSDVIGIVFDERIVITKNYFRHALEVMYDYYRSASKNVYDFAMS